jgi:hypothetical protein
MSAALNPALLPPIVRDLIEVVGEEAARQLVERFRGERLWVPSAPGPDHPITLCVGPELAARIGWWLSPGDNLDFPMLAAASRSARDAAILAAAESTTTSGLTQQFGVSRRTAFYAKQRAAKAQATPAKAQATPAEAPARPRDLLSDL